MSTYNKPYIIAEIGINHNGEMEIAKQLIDMAAGAGCDAVKFQKRTIDIVYDQDMLSGPRESSWGTTQRDQKEGLEFGQKEFDSINDYCKEKNIDWFASAWDIESQKFLQQYDCPYNKVASAMITHLPLMELIAQEGKHTFISTGMTTYEDIEGALDIFNSKECSYTLLHCVSTYPCEDEGCDVGVMTALKERFECPVGYSGHEKGILPSVVAAALGAEVIERHITLDRTMYGSDQSASLEKKGLETMVNYARSAKSIIGDSKKKFGEKEQGIAEKLRYF